ncbi:hypothetical protein U1Q18_013193 [Sarracenia purpurea var. burkii]
MKLAEAVRNIVMVREVLYELYNEYVDIHNSAHAEHGGQENARETGSSSVSSSHAIGRSFTSGRSKFESFIRRVDTIQPIKSDLDVYLVESVFICDKVQVRVLCEKAKEILMEESNIQWSEGCCEACREAV